jgi:hypothetical protein
MPVEHFRHHPDVHQPWAEWSEDETLHVAACYSNPFRWRTRRELANDFRRHLNGMPNVRLYMGELAYGDRPFEVTDPSQRLGDVQFRTTCELFHKENILNQVIKRFPPGWKYGAVVDADFHFTRHDIALETIHQLQHYDWVQMFSNYADLSGETYGTGHQVIGTNYGFAYNYIQNGYKLPDGYENGGWKKAGFEDCDDYHYAMAMGRGLKGVGATGGAWAFKRAPFDMCGGLLDRCILGHGDWFQTFGLVGEEAPDMHIEGYTPDYRQYIHAWQQNAAKLKKNIGYVDGFATHFFHGSKNRRAYASRDLILVKHKFAPTYDLKTDWQGIYQLTPDKPGLRDDIRRYFISRDENDPNLYSTGKGDRPR